MRHSLLLIFVSLLLVNCRGTLEGKPLTNTLYCDNFLIYDMCASDANGDGVVDYVYFTDSNEVFMYGSDGLARKPAEQPLHRCAQPMEDDLIATTSRLFYLDENSSALERTDIRGAMMIKYLAYLPEITACNLRAEEAERQAAEAQAEL